MTTQFQRINYHLGTDLYSMKTDKNNCCNDPTLVESRQRSQNDTTERPYKEAPCKEVNNTTNQINIYLYMTIETTRSKYSLWIGYFQDDTRKHVADGNRG